VSFFLGEGVAYEGTWVGGIDVEEGVGGDYWGYYTADGLKALSSLQSELGKTRRTAD